MSSARSDANRSQSLKQAALSKLEEFDRAGYDRDRTAKAIRSKIDEYRGSGLSDAEVIAKLAALRPPKKKQAEQRERSDGAASPRPAPPSTARSKAGKRKTKSGSTSKSKFVLLGGGVLVLGLLATGGVIAATLSSGDAAPSVANNNEDVPTDSAGSAVATLESEGVGPVEPVSSEVSDSSTAGSSRPVAGLTNSPADGSSTILASNSPSGVNLADAGLASNPNDVAKARQILSKFCVDCHGPDAQEGDLRIDNLSVRFDQREAAAAWIEIRDRMNLGEMPPEGSDKPEVHEVEFLSGWIAEELRRAERAALSRGGKVVLRRMSRQEYTNTIRDLLHMKFTPGNSPMDFLPPDGTAEGFDKLSLALMVDPSLLATYYEVAGRVADNAIVEGPPDFPTETLRMEFEEIAENRAINYLCRRPSFDCREVDIIVMEGSTRSFARLKYPDTNKSIATDGFYRVTVRAAADPGASSEPVVMRVSQGHPDDSKQEIMELRVTNPPTDYQDYTVVLPRDTLGGEWNVSIKNGTGFTSYSPINQQIQEATEAESSDRLSKKKDFNAVLRADSRMILEGAVTFRGRPAFGPEKIPELRKLYLDYIEIEGPLYDQWPPKSHEELFFKGESATEDIAYVREMFTRFLPRAWRRPVAAEEINPIVVIVEQELKNGLAFTEAVEVGIAAVLTSPNFIYIAEPNSNPSQRDLNNFEIANRLSYFLWSSMPDDELFDLAENGRLSDRDVLTAQIDRMLADPKIEGLVEGFAAQWLRTDTFRNFTPDKYKYKSYNPKLGEAMVEEPLAFFREILANDLSTLNFIDSDFTMANERLAKHYGIEGVSGEKFRKVSLSADSMRGGLLAMAGVAMAGADGDRTKPVSRGVYVREVLFNDPPDPPPPNAGEIEPNIKGKNLTVRERLLQHQEIESCAACHRTLDPYGLALENFNVIGDWRDNQDGEGFRGNNAPPIVVESKLPNGEHFSSFEQFRDLLLKQDDRFRRGLTEKMLIYALGRPVEPTDNGTIENIVAQMRSENSTFRSLIKGIVTSEQFLKK
ncbi:DUF1592 domain-containing protein [Stratiformator vulcanicus]|uniref:Planctomycete cytochrome C n=1 Tax=Stratiformator vulcanicus TaxID=2527980 RepID=A0A517QZZ6_9PLAN|nr:DUF1592 domain-containing protein [Stratiformator vulcanicus]QDT37219.1 Planctomycete cytochrome C [Stratiformator vulcanicus]